MKAPLTRALSTVIVWAGLCGAAAADTLIVNCGTTSGPAEVVSAAVLCPQFNLGGQVVSAISISISGGISGSITQTNNGNTTATGVGTTSTQFSFGALAGFTFVNPVFMASFTTGNRTISVGQTLTVSGLSGSGNGALGSNTTSFAPYVGAGNFTIVFSTATVLAATGTGGSFAASAFTNANATAVVTYTYAPAPPLPQNFDGLTTPSLPFGWSSDVSGNGVAWTTVATSPVDTAPNAAFGPETAAVGLTNLNSPTIAVPAGDWQLRFRNLYNLESTFDGMVLEIRIGAGAYTDILATGGTFAVGGYTGPLSGSFGNPLAGRNAWSGLSAGTTGAPSYITTVVNLPPAASGQNIQLRWRVGSDVITTAVGQPGARIDSITLRQTPTVVTGVATGITIAGAILNGTVDPHGTSMLGHFDYGPTASYGSTTPIQKLGGGSKPVPIGGGDISGLACGTAYHFRAVATTTDGSITNGLDALFATTAGKECAFTDNPLAVGATEIKTVHISQLRSRIDALRVRFGLGTFAWTDPTLTSGMTVIRAVHIIELRGALEGAYKAAGRSVPGFTDLTLAGVQVKVVHIEQLRSAVIGLE